MNDQIEYWNKLFSEFRSEEPDHDGWLERYSEILRSSKGTPIIDLGCGSGHNSIYLKNKGYEVIPCDFSENALKRVRYYIPDSKTMNFDILDGLPFDAGTIQIIISDLSIHYFSHDDTYKVIEDIKRVLKKTGYLICRLNSTNDINYGAGKGEKLENNYYKHNGKLKRFFDKADMNMFFSGWNIEYMEESEMHRYGDTKIVWEIAARKK